MGGIVHRLTRVAIAAIALLGTVAGTCLFAARDGQTPAPESRPSGVTIPALPPPLTSGPTPDLELLFSSQVAGWIEPCG